MAFILQDLGPLLSVTIIRLKIKNTYVRNIQLKINNSKKPKRKKLQGALSLYLVKEPKIKQQSKN
jgi:hypothetical protein